MFRLAVCKLFSPRHGLPGMCAIADIMTAPPEGAQAQTVLAVDVSELDTKLVSHDHSKRRQAAVWHCLQPHLWHGTSLGSMVNSLNKFVLSTYVNIYRVVALNGLLLYC